LIITIDGPAGAGKSTVARSLAQRLGFDFLDTGATYRAATWRALEDGVRLDDPEAVARVACAAKIEFVQTSDERRVLCDGQDVTTQIRSPEVTANVRYVADEPAARKALIEFQRRYARGRNVVSEGRDQGTEVFPDADVKFYLDASPRTRAARRMGDMKKLGIAMSLEKVYADLVERDKADRSRPVGRLRQSDDMIVIDSTDLSVDQVVDRMAQAVVRRRTGQNRP
jgi:cytidylate kinase/pantoate ligase/cytidylate kinase